VAVLAAVGAVSAGVRAAVAIYGEKTIIGQGVGRAGLEAVAVALVERTLILRRNQAGVAAAGGR
jgi:hypothetical protein